MKQYLSPEQTAKLIELGFEKPKGLADAEPSSGKWVRPAYSVGELIEMLPKYPEIKSQQCFLNIYPTKNKWYVSYENIVFRSLVKIFEIELTDALYAMVLQLKEEGVI